MGNTPAIAAGLEQRIVIHTALDAVTQWKICP